MFSEYRDVMTVAETANALRTERHTVYQLINQGSLQILPPTGKGHKVIKQSLINYVNKK